MSQNVNVNLVPGNYPKEFHVSQYDVGRQLVANIVDSTGAYSIPSGATVTLVGTKPSGFGFTLSGTVGSGGVVTFSTTATVTAEYGRIPCEIRIASGDTVLGTANLMLIVEESPHQEGVIDGNSEAVIPELTILVERVEAAASNVLDMQVEADTLPAGSSATYSYNEETNTATFGIPQGEAGAGAAGVVASAYSASSTYAVGDYVIHDGNLYRCTTAITTAEAFTAAHWTQVVLGDDVSDLKSDLIDIYNGNILLGQLVYGQYVTSSTGAFANGSSSDVRTGYIEIPAGMTKLKIIATESSNYNAFYDSSYNRVAGLSFNVGTTILTIPTNAKYFALSGTKGHFESTKVSIENKLSIIEMQMAINNLDDSVNALDADVESLKNELIVFSQNIFDKSTSIPHSYVSLNGVQTSESYEGWFTSDIIPISGQSKLQSNIPLNSVVFYDANDVADQVNSQTLLNNTVSLPVTIPNTAKKMRVSAKMVWYYSDIMLNFGDTLLPYSRYGDIKLVDGLLKENPNTAKLNFAHTNGEYLDSYKQSIAKNVCVSYFANFDTFTSLQIGFTNTSDYTEGYTDYFEITSTSLILHREDRPNITWEHGLTLKDYIGVLVTFDFALNYHITLTTNGSSFTNSNYIYLGKSYYPFAIMTGTNVSNKKLSFACNDNRRNVALFGDSYISNNSARWIYYLSDEEKSNILINGYAGESSASAIIDFMSVINIASPKYVIWALGMNDGSDTNDSTPSASWLSNIQKVINACNYRNIVPVLATIPSVPSINNRAKSAWVRASGYQYIDFAKAVNSDNNGNWYSGMLSNDNVHPTVEGAKALYSRAITDFSQLLVESN